MTAYGPGTQIVGGTRVVGGSRIVGGATTSFTPGPFFIQPQSGVRYALAALGGASYTQGTNNDSATDTPHSTSQVLNNVRLVNSTSTHGSQSTALVPLVPIAGDGGSDPLEDPGLGFCNEFARLWQGQYSSGLIYHQRAVGGQPFTSFLNGSGSYTNSMGCIDDAVTEASPDSVVYIGLLEGGSSFFDETGGVQRADNTPNTSWATTEGRIDTLLDDWRTELASRTGQTFAPQTITWQFGFWQLSGGLGETPIEALYAFEQLDKALTDRNYLLSEPTYQYAFASDGIHKTVDGYLRIGHMLAWALHVEVILGRRWLPLHCNAVDWSGNTVTLDYALPYGSSNLVLDETAYSWRGTLADGTTHGFRYVPNVGAARTVTDVSVSGARVTLTLSGDGESGATIGYADIGSGPDETPPNGNLATNVFRTSDGVAMNNFACCQQMVLA